MIGQKCKICEKIIREHLVKRRIAKHSEEFNNIKKFLSPDKKPVLLKNINNNERLAVLLPEDEKGNVFIIEQVGETYQLFCCSDECRQEDERIKREKKLERRKQNYLISKLLPQIEARCKNRCISCGSSENLEIHHIKPLSEGGKAELENLVLLCKDCHLIVTNKSNSKTKKWIFTDFSFARINPEFKFFKKRIEERIDMFKK